MGIYSDDSPTFRPQLIPRTRFSDDRGYLEMIFRFNEIRENYPDLPCPAQVNLIVSQIGSIRGFHGSDIQNNHWKYITCVRGAVADLTLNLILDGSEIGKVEEHLLESDNPSTLVIPPGFAHAMQSLTQDSIIIYGTNIDYSENREFEILPTDPSLNIVWKFPYVLSERDSKAQNLMEYLEKSRGVNK